jgi:hypothetical protein
MGRVAQQFAQPAVKARVHRFIAALQGGPAPAAIQGVAGQPGFNIRHSHQQLTERSFESILCPRVAAGVNLAILGQIKPSGSRPRLHPIAIRLDFPKIFPA